MNIYLIADAWIKRLLQNNSEFWLEIKKILEMDGNGSITAIVKGDENWDSYICCAMLSIKNSDRIVMMRDPYSYGSYEGNIELNYALLTNKSVECYDLPSGLREEMLKYKEENNHEERY